MFDTIVTETCNYMSKSVFVIAQLSKHINTQTKIVMTVFTGPEFGYTMDLRNSAGSILKIVTVFRNSNC